MAVINKYHYGGKVPPGAVNIMRGTRFGNKFEIGKDGDRATVVRKHKRYLFDRIQSDAEFAAEVEALDGQDLCCCCDPLPCHGDNLEKAARWLKAKKSALLSGGQSEKSK